MNENIKRIFEDLLLNSSNDDYISLFVDEVRKHKLVLSIHWLNETPKDEIEYCDLLVKMNQMVVFKNKKLEAIKRQDFEDCASWRSKEHEVMDQIENHNFCVDYFNGIPLLFNFSFDKEIPKLEFKILTYSHECIVLLKRIKEQVNCD